MNMANAYAQPPALLAFLTIAVSAEALCLAGVLVRFFLHELEGRGNLLELYRCMIRLGIINITPVTDGKDQNQ